MFNSKTQPGECFCLLFRVWKSAMDFVPLSLVYLYVDVGEVLDLWLRVQTVRRSSIRSFIQAAVPWRLTKAPTPLHPPPATIIGPAEWFLCESIKPHPLFFMHSFLFSSHLCHFCVPFIPLWTQQFLPAELKQGRCWIKTSVGGSMRYIQFLPAPV